MKTGHARGLRPGRGPGAHPRLRGPPRGGEAELRQRSGLRPPSGDGAGNGLWPSEGRSGEVASASGPGATDEG